MPPPRSNYAHPPEQPCTPPRATMHAPRSNHAHPACPPWSNHACPPEQPRMPPPPPGATMHAPLEQPRTPPLWTECGHTFLKILPCPNFVAGGNNEWYITTRFCFIIWISWIINLSFSLLRKLVLHRFKSLIKYVVYLKLGKRSRATHVRNKSDYSPPHHTLQQTCNKGNRALWNQHHCSLLFYSVRLT